MKQKLLLLTGLLFISITVNAQIEFDKTTIDATAGNQPYTIASGHFTNDAYLDIAIATYAGSKVSWYKNNGDGTFAPKITLVAIGGVALSYIESITVADIDGDGEDDIIATSYSNNNLVWFENNGDETFQPAVLISAGLLGAGNVLTANIDNDPNGYLDIVVTEYAGNKVSYFLGNGDGTFGVKREIFAAIPGSGPGSFDIADFDADGDLDIVVSFIAGKNIKLYDNRLIQDGLDLNGNIPFNSYTNDVTTGNDYIWKVLFADINDDTQLKIVKSNNEPGTNPAIAYYTNDMSGAATTFTETTIPSTIGKSAAIGVADFNNDSYNDIIIASGRASDVPDITWFQSNASGGFGIQNAIDDGSSSVFDVEIQDFDNDGDLDFVGASYLQNDLFIFLNDLLTLSTPEFQVSEFSIYPNPTSNSLNFKTSTSESFDVQVYDILGKEVLNTTVFNNILNISTLTNGVYLLKVENSDKTFKFVKQ